MDKLTAEGCRRRREREPDAVIRGLGELPAAIRASGTSAANIVGLA